MKKQLFKLSVILILTVPALHSETAQNQSILEQLKNGIRTGTNLILSSGDVSEENNTYSQKLFKQVDAEGELPPVKKMNKLMEYLLGYKNSIAIPCINQIYVNEKWLDRLPEVQKRFIIGRAIGWLKNGKSYLATQFLTGGCIALLENKQYSDMAIYAEKIRKSPEDKKFEIALQAGKQNQSFALLIAASKLLNIYTNRMIAYSADEYAVKNFDCVNGAIPLIENLQVYESDNSTLGELFAYWPIAYWAPAILNRIKLSSVSKALEALNFVPGRLHNTPSELGHTFKRLPLVNYFSRYPVTESRAIALEKHLNTNN